MPLARAFNEIGGALRSRGRLTGARLAYAGATALAPGWSAAWFNRGLIAKSERRWADCRTFNRRAAALDPNDPPTWWNLGIASTALGDWETAREAWSRYGIAVPDGTGPIEMDLGPVPIRVSPVENPEVVWCRRLDPARAVIRSIPTPESGHGYGDIVLNDGEPRGKRVHSGRELSVFDELQLLAPGRLHTFAVRLVAPQGADVTALEDAASADVLAVEDWHASIVWHCRACSEGNPHDHHERPPMDWEPERLVGVAAVSAEAARDALAAWAGGGSGRHIGSIECVLRRHEE